MTMARSVVALSVYVLVALWWQPTVAADRIKVIDSYRSADQLPSLSAAVWTEDALVYADAVGWSDLENKVAASAQTVYRVGSVAKPITATAAMQLAAAAQLDLDRPVQHYCVAFPEHSSAPTTRQLLAHLGGIRHYNYRRFTEEFLSNVDYASVNDALAVFAADPLVNEPGSEFHYSSFGYVLVGCAVEAASGQSFGDYVDQTIAEPAGMLQFQLDRAPPLISFRARPYSRNRDGELTNSPAVNLSDRFPAGGFVATPTDLVRFGAALFEGRLLDDNSWQQMLRQQTLADGTTIESALGWQLTDNPDERVHGGTAVGGSAYLYLHLPSQTVVAIATNVDRWTEPRLELARKLAGRMTPKVSALP
ncbi:MAG: hypothetical protein DHS20C11_01950 [Lysobacteraceae bacterium]|nr:MAG: hypothetical protein DHS20C11_01950 [Xanthomonadaceae bacterium]